MSSGLYSDNVKKFIERYISYIEDKKLFDIFNFANNDLDIYERNVLADILSEVIDNFDNLRRKALIAMVNNKLIDFKLRKDKVDSISILAFIHTYFPSTFNLPERQFVQLVLDNKSRWPNHIKFDPRLYQWRVFK